MPYNSKCNHVPDHRINTLHRSAEFVDHYKCKECGLYIYYLRLEDLKDKGEEDAWGRKNNSRLAH